jgi:hypothetical protein
VLLPLPSIPSSVMKHPLKSRVPLWIVSSPRLTVTCRFDYRETKVRIQPRTGIGQGCVQVGPTGREVNLLPGLTKGFLLRTLE